MSFICEWLRDLLTPPEPDPNWTASGAYLEHLRDGRTDRERRSDD